MALIREGWGEMKEKWLKTIRKSFFNSERQTNTSDIIQNSNDDKLVSNNSVCVKCCVKMKRNE